MQTYDVIVIGAGMAGLTAALTASENGSTVVMLARGLGNLYSSSGHIDLIGYYPSDSNHPVSNPIDTVARLIEENPAHPYAAIGIPDITDSFERFIERSHEMGLPYAGALAENRMLPTAVGGLAPTCLVPETSRVDCGREKRLFFLGFSELGDFYPELAAANAKAWFGNRVFAGSISLGLSVDREMNGYDIARRLEEEAAFSRFLEQAATHVSDDTVLCVPAVMGVENSVSRIREAEQRLGCTVLEIPTMPPSVMGYRLAEALRGMAVRKGIDCRLGTSIADIEISDPSCARVSSLSRNGRRQWFQAKRIVLATGGILGEGLRVLPDGIQETVLGLPVYCPSPVVTADFFSRSGQGFAAAGVRVNSDLNPVDQSGAVLYDNLHVAGATIAGYDQFIEKNGNGVAMSSGYKAGRLAAIGSRL